MGLFTWVFNRNKPPCVGCRALLLAYRVFFMGYCTFRIAALSRHPCCVNSKYIRTHIYTPMYVHIYVYVDIYMYIYIHIHIHIYIWIYIHMRVYIYIYICIYLCVYIQVYIYVYIYMRDTYIYENIHTYIYIYTYYMYMYIYTYGLDPLHVCVQGIHIHVNIKGHTWQDSRVCVQGMYIYICICTCILLSGVTRDSFVCDTWLIHVRGVTHSYLRRDSSVVTWSLLIRRVLWRIHIWDMTHPYLRRDSWVAPACVRCNVVQCGAVYCSYTTQSFCLPWHTHLSQRLRMCVAVCCSALQWVAVCCSSITHSFCLLWHTKNLQGLRVCAASRPNQWVM